MDNKAASAAYYGPTRGTVYDARAGMPALAGGQVLPVYACEGTCDASQPYAGADSSQAVPITNGEFHFNQLGSELTGYYISVPGYRPQFVPRSFRNPAQPVVYAYSEDGEDDPMQPEEEGTEPTEPSGEEMQPEGEMTPTEGDTTPEGEPGPEQGDETGEVPTGEGESPDEPGPDDGDSMSPGDEPGSDERDPTDGEQPEDGNEPGDEGPGSEDGDSDPPDPSDDPNEDPGDPSGSMGTSRGAADAGMPMKSSKPKTTKSPTTPKSPSTPTTPKSPTTPTTPKSPTSPTTPKSPTTPSTPKSPTSPTTPKSPTTPTTPTTPKSPTSPTTPSMPKTSSMPKSSGIPDDECDKPSANSRMVASDELPSVFLCPDDAADSDGDGICDEAELKYATDPMTTDSDGDLLSDASELYGYKSPDGGFLDLPAMGANPSHMDVFLQVDYYSDRAPAPSALQQVVKAYADSPRDNPDQTKGINLHVCRASKPIPASEVVKVITRWSQVNDIKRKHFKPERAYAFHYALFANRIGSATSKSSGMSPDKPSAADLVVSLGGWTTPGGTPFQQAGTLMHELGHNMGLDHGGSDKVNYKPNYLSVMNYSYQTDGLTVDGKTIIDYARYPVGALVESSLLETAAFAPAGNASAQAGLARYTNLIFCTRQRTKDNCTGWRTLRTGTAGADLDFNNNRKIDQTPVSADLNGANGKKDQFNALDDDWIKRLRFDGLPRVNGKVAVVDLDDAPIVPCSSEPESDAADSDSESETP